MGFKHHIPSKRARINIKMFSLCEVSGYLTFYIGKGPSADNNESEKELGKSGAVVPKLMQDLHRKSHHLYIDNWYTSKKLFEHPERNGTAACGAARSNRLKVPPSLER